MAFTLYQVGPELEPTPFLVNGLELRFDTGKEAAEAAMQFSPIPPYTKIQPRRVVESQIDDSTWRERELARFATGEYARTVWHAESWFYNNPLTADHYAHISIKSPGKVSFTLTPEKGRADIQERGMNP